MMEIEMESWFECTLAYYVCSYIMRIFYCYVVKIYIHFYTIMYVRR